jgi:hypothetical protein
MFYTTIYVAVEGGFLSDQGLEVDFDHIPIGRPAQTYSKPEIST